MNSLKSRSNDWAANTVRNTRLLGFWTAGWVLTIALANFGPKFIWNMNTSLTILAIVLNLAIGFGMILANKRHLNGLDELHQKIQTDAMALSLGVGLIVGLGYSTLDTTHIISFHAEISHLVMLMSLTYLAGVIGGTRKYR
jgi:predicted membrane protein